MDIGKIKENLRKREMLKKASVRDRFEAANRDFDNIVRMILETYAPKKIIQWGSLLHPEQFDAHSDIDIALEGITDAETYFALLGDAMALTRLPLDIVQLPDDLHKGSKFSPNFLKRQDSYSVSWIPAGGLSALIIKVEKLTPWFENQESAPALPELPPSSFSKASRFSL